MSVLKKEIDLSIWSIKVFNSRLISSEKPDVSVFSSPSITAKDVTDVPAEFVADPFVVSNNSEFYLFFEVLNKRTERGEIGLAISTDGEIWDYQKIVLKEKHHLSYPHVFKYKGEFYMTPESSEVDQVFLYKSRNFPLDWEKVCPLVNGKYTDPTVFNYEGKWWMFTGTPKGDLHLFYSDKIDGTWDEHSLSPLLKSNNNISRPAGRVIIHNDTIYRFTQDSEPYYGKQVRSFKINKLSENEYQEEECCIILNASNGENWRKDGMHHIDQLEVKDNQWLIAVDGHIFKKQNYFKWKFRSLLRAPLPNMKRFIKNRVKITKKDSHH